MRPVNSDGKAILNALHRDLAFWLRTDGWYFGAYHTNGVSPVTFEWEGVPTAQIKKIDRIEAEVILLPEERR